MSDNSYSQAQAQASSIAAMVAALEVDYDRLEELRDELQELSDAFDEAKQADGERPAGWSALKEKAARLDHYDKTGELELPTVQAVTNANAALLEWQAENSEELAELEDAAGDCESREEAERRIDEDALSIEVRTSWHTPGDNPKPDEFKILLCTGGPAVQIVGELDDGQPTRAWIEHQDWFESWQEYHGGGISQDTLLTYCRCFYFGE